jgi:hypothetical protein
VRRNNRKQGHRTGISASRQKTSEMIWEFAGEFIISGKTLEEKQNRLNAACNAWNISCNPSEVWSRSLDQYVESYMSYNPEASVEDVSGVRNTMTELIQNKLRIFPSVQKQIVGAKITQVDGKDRIEVASAKLY